MPSSVSEADINPSGPGPQDGAADRTQDIDAWGSTAAGHAADAESGCLGDRTRRLQSWSAVSVVAVAVRAIRGAIRIDRDERDELLGAVAELLKAILDRNQLTTDELISVIFTVTPDIRSEFPALGARLLGMKDVPLLCAQEIDVPGAMERVVRVMVYVDTPAARAEIQHVYLRGAETLRKDIAQ